MNMCFIIPIIVGLICAWLGYLLGKLKSNTNSHNEDWAVWKSRYETTYKELEECRNPSQQPKSSSELGIKSIKSSRQVDLPFNPTLARTVFGRMIKQDDLTVIEGIGPKISELFQSYGIVTWQSLSETSVERCQQILDTEGERYKIHNPGTWPRQALMAYEGKWSELLAWQDVLDGGKE